MPKPSGAVSDLLGSSGRLNERAARLAMSGDVPPLPRCGTPGGTGRSGIVDYLRRILPPMFLNTRFPGKSAALVAFLLAISSAAPALAYVGPGAGLTALGSLVAVVAVVVLAVIGFLWYPLKRVMRRRKEPRGEHLE
jgi:hypothetical protein